MSADETPGALVASSADFELALRVYDMIASGGPAEFLLFRSVSGDPWSKSRPRLGRRGVYTNPADTQAEMRMGYALKSLAPGGPLTGNVSLGCVFFRSNRQRIDVDNLLKHVCDAATGVLWVDDSQVTSLFGRIELDKANPRTLVVVGQDETSTMTRGSDAVKPCEQCGKPFSVIGSRARAGVQRYCTQRCARTAISGGIDLSEPVPCVACGELFRRRTSSQKYCGSTCAYTKFRLPRPAQRVSHLCVDCGGQRARANSQRCRACWIAARSKGLA